MTSLPWTQVLPFAEVGRILGLSILGCIVLIPNHFLDWHPIVQLLVFGPAYGAATTALLVKAGVVDGSVLRRFAQRVRRKLGR